MASRAFLVTGATGNQGGAVVNALLAMHSSSPEKPTILAVTRNPDSPGAQKLAAKSKSIKLVRGDLGDPAALFKDAGMPVWGVFSVQLAAGMSQDAKAEVAQGKGLIDASLKNGVKHFVQTSVDRGGDERSWTNPTNIPHFATKHEIELYLRDQSAQKGGRMSWTILRPVAFADNLVPGFQTRVFMAALAKGLKEKPLQFVAAKDIGIFGAKAFLNSDDPTFHNKAISLAGDELNLHQISQTFKEAAGKPLDPTFGVFASGLMMAMKEIALMVKWFGSEGYGADINKCRSINPEMMDLKSWVKQSSWVQS